MTLNRTVLNIVTTLQIYPNDPSRKPGRLRSPAKSTWLSGPVGYVQQGCCNYPAESAGPEITSMVI